LGLAVTLNPSPLGITPPYTSLSLSLIATVSGAMQCPTRRGAVVGRRVAKAGASWFREPSMAISARSTADAVVDGNEAAEDTSASLPCIRNSYSLKLGGAAATAKPNLASVKATSR
jgi:hypothetical protein